MPPPRRGQASSGFSRPDGHHGGGKASVSWVYLIELSLCEGNPGIRCRVVFAAKTGVWPPPAPSEPGPIRQVGLDHGESPAHEGAHPVAPDITGSVVPRVGVHRTAVVGPHHDGFHGRVLRLELVGTGGVD